MENEKRFKLKMPHTYVLLGIILIIAALMTYIIPAGEYDRVEDPNSGRMVVDAESYHEVDQNPQGVLEVFVSIQEGMIESADIIFFIFFSYGLVYVTLATGAMDAGIGALLRLLKDKVYLIIPIFMLIFGIMGSTVGIYEEVYGLIPVFMGMFMAFGFDSLTGAAVVTVGVGTGFAAAISNPFTIGVAQKVAEVDLFSGKPYRIICFILFQAAAVIYVMYYARKVRNNPSKSAVYGLDFSGLKTKSREELMELKFTGRQILALLAFLVTFGVVFWGVLAFEWYINEIAAVFIMGMLVIGIIGGYGPSKIVDLFLEACKGIIFGALIVGLARSILIVLQNGMIVDSVVHALANLLSGANKYVSAVGMMLIQNIINFFIPSGSGQAAVTMPVMAPVADLLGLSRQTAVLAFQFGDGFSNLFWPTAAATLTGIMGIPFGKWFKFISKLFLIFLILQAILMCVAVLINFS